jgi:ubiquitin carboxyl-terminal hydrolase 34
VTEKYLDFSFEKTNSAYMLFYECRAKEKKESNDLMSTPSCSTQLVEPFNNFEENNISMEDGSTSGSQKLACEKVKKKSLLSKELEEWIWQDNRHYLEDRNIFEHTYFK